ncbi:glutamate decarboxylase [Prauserella marina]|uniref:Glutamate decarboxylase n=1 Tax=Prauserella marina TaxID=530584 RepID=A0A222VQ88_9PSEU|nr:glutamate decarboxylase [Prauserella marina]ASR36078.1 glutamate decarboxylase [Prauserella marina]PWV76808.1 glutamate decarboxylase [Prauserella marina]SDC98059.1 glutamate decarboxylase [Prauserella marina]
MALHKIGDEDGARFDDVYASPLSGRELAKLRIGEQPHDPAVVYQLIHDELDLDGNAAQNLATFCTTWNDPLVHTLMNENMNKNMIDKDEYPQTAEIESRCVNILADLWHAGRDAAAVGCSTTGSSEAGMLGGLALKWRWRARRKADGKPADRPNLVCGPVQVCWEKFARYFDVELRQVPLLDDATGLRPEQLRDYVDENTIGVVAILGVTFTCDYEPVKAIAAELDAIQRDTGLDIPIHIDGASGGFIAPFIQPELEWDFRITRVSSINTSGHKYGLAPLGVGWIVWRSAEDLPEELVFRVDYLGGDMPTFALNFSRPGSEVIAQYYLLLRLGREGYRRVQQACSDTAAWLADQVAAMGPFTMLYSGRGALPALSYTLSDPGEAGFTLYELSDELRMRGWQVAAYPLPPRRQETVIHRVLIRHGISTDKAALFARDLRDAVAHLRNPREGRPIAFHH